MGPPQPLTMNKIITIVLILLVMLVVGLATAVDQYARPTMVALRCTDVNGNEVFHEPYISEKRLEGSEGVWYVNGVRVSPVQHTCEVSRY